MDTLNEINVLVTLDENYLPHLNVMLFTLIETNHDCIFSVYLLHTSVRSDALKPTEKILGNAGRLIPIQTHDLNLNHAPTTERYPKEIYYRIFAARYLPETLDRILYLDPDLVVNSSIVPLYRMDMGNNYFAAASHTGPFLQKLNTLRLDMEMDEPYINSGVMLMNLPLLRRDQNFEDVFDFIEERRKLLVLPDQDIISGLYGNRIYVLDAFRYNMTERLYQLHAPFGKDLDWVRENSVIIHYCGRNKPWKEHYIGQLDVFYKQAKERLMQIS